MTGKRFAYSIVCCVVLLAAAARVNACSYPTPPTFRSALEGAKAVFVFRLDQAEYKREAHRNGTYSSWIEGRITLIQNLHGMPIQYKRIRYQSSWCGGLNLVVGHHYLVATRASGDTIQLVADDRSLLDIEGHFDPKTKQTNLLSPVVLPVIQAIYGVKPLPAEYPPPWIAGRTGVPPPPPPPPSTGKRE